MSDIEDFETTVLPLEDFQKILGAARHGIVDMGTKTVSMPFIGNMSLPHQVSAMGYLEELAKNPEKGSPEWQKALIGAGTGAAASTVGLGVLMAATGPLAPFAAIGLGVAAPFLGKNRVCTLLVANATEGELVKDGLYIDHGIQTGRPVVEEINEDTGRATATSPDSIPGFEFLEGWPEEDIPDMWLGGLGLYRFEKDLSLVIGWYGTCGAIGFRSSDPKTKNKRFAVSWLVPETGKPAFAVTADLDGKYDSLEDFYEQTAGERKSDNLDYGKHRGKTVAKIRGSMVHRAYPDTENDNDLLVTVAITAG